MISNKLEVDHVRSTPYRWWQGRAASHWQQDCPIVVLDFKLVKLRLCFEDSEFKIHHQPLFCNYRFSLVQVVWVVARVGWRGDHTC